VYAGVSHLKTAEQRLKSAKAAPSSAKVIASVCGTLEAFY
jgi:hypothetical protein